MLVSASSHLVELHVEIQFTMKALKTRIETSRTRLFYELHVDKRVVPGAVALGHQVLLDDLLLLTLAQLDQLLRRGVMFNFDVLNIMRIDNHWILL